MILGLSLLSVCCYLLILWVISGKGTVASWSDVGWASSVGLLACVYAVTGSGDLERRVLLAVLPGLWALRLSLHFYKSRVATGHVDSRFAELSSEWGEKASSYFAVVFLIQALLAYVLSLQFYFLAADSAPLGNGVMLVGIALFVIAFFGEWHADRQLLRFQNVSGNTLAVCNEGLWKYSRHPNYFFECLHWLSYVIIAMGTGVWWISLCSALLMLALILFVTGIPYTEAVSVKRRGELYVQYQKTTSVFLPWFPKKDTV